MNIVSPVKTKERADLGVRSGDTVRVWQKIQEKDKIRLQAFEGIVLAVKHGSEAGSTFTVRRTSGGVGIEKIFPLYSPMIDKIEIVKRAKVRRAKLYHLREKAAKEIRRQMRNANLTQISTTSDIEENAKAEKEEKAKKEQIEKEVVEKKEEEVKAEKSEEPKTEEKPQKSE
jgi:large subunit ribosomal protein L19